MKKIHNNRFNLIHDNKIGPEDVEELNLFIFCMYFMAVILTGCLIAFIYQNF